MFSDLVQRRQSARMAPWQRFTIGLLLCLMLAPTAHSAWQDPLATPAMATELAHQELLLDVTRADQRLIAVGAHGHIIYSDDHGQSWQQARVPVKVTLTSVHFPSGKYGWAVGHDGVILHSNDGGASWIKQFEGFRANDAIVAAAKQLKATREAQLASAEEQGDDVAIEEAEIQLENATFALDDALYDQETGSTKPFLDVWFYDARRGFAVGAYGMAFYTADGGQTWQDISARIPNPDRMHLNAIEPVGATALTLIGEAGTLIRSDDLGGNWRAMLAPYEGSLFGLVQRDDEQWLFGLRGHVFHSRDDGISWTELSTGSEQTLLGGVSTRDNTVLVGNGGSVIVLQKVGNNIRSIIIEGRKAYAGVAQTSEGGFILVGEDGVKRLSAEGELLNTQISMASGE
ncbi:photosystem I reaction center subunit IV [Bacterioplanes sanyensis]|uniref:Photosystem I reaction center subunit IV n=1 Tax=Bacterioplanes sanyensis TaxID=1249553 RepID=A0A222FN91_9GAMM|nr:YCF48-related protein [Bacterioplanes sanyensis]ASP40497.1 photosystem I reaction center subunit IV [Bacterioplanes sanyensis]